MQADCPTLRLSGGVTSGRCYSCGQIGHLAVSLKGMTSVATNWSQRNCPNPGTAPPIRGGAPAARGGYGGGFRGGFVGGNRAATCYKCGGPNHYARDCQAQAMKCYACGKLVCLKILEVFSRCLQEVGAYLARLYCSQRRSVKLGWESVLQVWPSRPYLARLHDK